MTPCHTHYEKKEDIIVRHGTVKFTLWNKNPEENKAEGTVEVKINRKMETKTSGEPFELKEGERVTLTAGVWHEFAPVHGPALIGEVSTYCNEETDNVFANKKIDIFQAPEADEKVLMPCC